MKTYIDFSILNDFFSSQPQRIPSGSEEDNRYWNSFWNFLRFNTDLYVIGKDEDINSNYNNIYYNFYKALSTGRGESLIATIPKIKEYKCELNVKNPHSYFCLNKIDEKEKNRYRKNNGNLIGFKDDYPHSWKKLSLEFIPKKITVRKKVPKDGFKTWDQLNPYLLPFTDILISDPYILSDSDLIKYNLEKLLIVFDAQTPVPYNLTLYTFEGDNPKQKIDISHAEQLFKDIKVRNNLKYKANIVISNRASKEHDRGIFTNYLRITSGDTFIFLDSNQKIISKGTEITFCSMADPVEFDAAQEIFAGIRESVNTLTIQERAKRICGEIQKNKLLYPDKL